MQRSTISLSSMARGLEAGFAAVALDQLVHDRVGIGARLPLLYL